LDRARRAFYELKVENALLRLKGNAFQDWFSELMQLRFPGGDFVRVRPWGKLGDRKNDGYIRSRRTLCQVHAPDEASGATTLRKILRKIDEDFAEAKPYWQEHFDVWVFVHNSPSGLPADVLKHLLDKQAANQPIQLRDWGPADMRTFLFELSDEHIARHLGPAPGRRDFENLGLKDLTPVLLKLAAQEPMPEVDVRPVPPGKIEANALSPSVSQLLKAGMPKADLVQRFFDNFHDSSLGDRIAAAFKERYAELRGTGLGPDAIFSRLVQYAGGLDDESVEHSAAVLSVIAYLFEQCDIFERPRDRAEVPS